MLLIDIHLFDDIEKKTRNHSCESFYFVMLKEHIDKNARATCALIFYQILHFALGINPGDLYDRITHTKKLITYFR